MNLLESLEKARPGKKHPGFSVGDTLKVFYKMIEGGRERVQSLEGIVIGKTGTGARESFTLRRIAHGVGVERTFLLDSPRLEKIELSKRGEVKKAKLYYLRDKTGKQARVKEKKG